MDRALMDSQGALHKSFDSRRCSANDALFCICFSTRLCLYLPFQMYPRQGRLQYFLLWLSGQKAALNCCWPMWVQDLPPLPLLSLPWMLWATHAKGECDSVTQPHTWTWTCPVWHPAFVSLLVGDQYILPECCRGFPWDWSQILPWQKSSSTEAEDLSPNR